MSVIFIVEINMKNETEYRKYLEKCDEVFNKYKGKYLAIDDEFKVIEGKNNSSRIVLIEFESEIEFNEWYNSKDYQDIIKYRLKGSECNSVLVHGK